jgi:hypothetical protein
VTKGLRIDHLKVFSTVLVGVIMLAFGLGLASAQELEWTDAMKAAQRAFEGSRYADAEQLLRIAVKEAEKFGPEDRRLATTLSSLGTVLYAQGKYARASATRPASKSNSGEDARAWASAGRRRPHGPGRDLQHAGESGGGRASPETGVGDP